MMIHTFLLIFTLSCILVNVNSLCGICHSNHAVCWDENHFSMCTGGKAENIIYTCPDGYVCTVKTSICLPQSETKPVTPACEMTCGQCNSTGKLFSCLSNTTYALCFGQDVPDLSGKGVCPDGYVCNLKSSEICTNATTDLPSCNAKLEQKGTTTLFETTLSYISTVTPNITESYGKTSVVTEADPTIDEKVTTIEVTSFKPTSAMVTTDDDDISVTSSTPSTLTTTQKSDYESNFCEEKHAEGVYRPSNDPTCQKFILCYYLSGQYLELQYTCSSSNFYNDQTKNCQTGKPVECQ